MTEVGEPRRAVDDAISSVVNDDRVEVTAAGLMAGFCQAHMLELIIRGVERRRGSQLCWELFTGYLLPAVGVVERQRPAAPRGRVNCLSASVTKVAEALAAPFDELVVTIAAGRHRRVPVATLSRADRDRLVWVLEAVRRVANGVDPLDAARGASDAAAGRPRQRRAPVGSGWLAAELAEVREATWTALVAARLYRDGPPWLDRLGSFDEWLSHTESREEVVADGKRPD